MFLREVSGTFLRVSLSSNIWTCKTKPKSDWNRVYNKVTSLVGAATSDRDRCGKTMAFSWVHSPLLWLNWVACIHLFLSHMLQRESNRCKMERKRKTRVTGKKKNLLFTLLREASLMKCISYCYYYFVICLTISIYESKFYYIIFNRKI